MTLATVAQVAPIAQTVSLVDFAPICNTPADYEQDAINMDAMAQEIAIDAEDDGYEGLVPRFNDAFYMVCYMKGAARRDADDNREMGGDYDDEF